MEAFLYAFYVHAYACMRFLRHSMHFIIVSIPIFIVNDDALGILHCLFFEGGDRQPILQLEQALESIPGLPLYFPILKRQQC